MHTYMNRSIEPDLKKNLKDFPVFSTSWEGFSLENILAAYPGHDPYFYRTSSGVEIDLVLEKGKKELPLNSRHQKAPHCQKAFIRH